MTKTMTIHTRIEPEIKEQADAILSDLGISTSEAINIFLRQVVFYRGLPFVVKLPNADTLKAMEETEEILQRGEPRFSSIEEMFEELDR